MKKIAVIHTSLAIRESVDNEILKQIPGAETHNIIDERLLKDVVGNGGIDSSVVKRMCLYVAAAEAMGASVILNACSSVGEAFDMAKLQTNVPCVRIDEPMAEQAVTLGNSVAVYGTVATTLAPSKTLIENTAKKLGRDVSVTGYLIDGAFKVLSEEKDVEKHNKMVGDMIFATHAKHDVIVLAQASMAVLIPELKSLGKPVLFSLESGVGRVKSLLER